jgi:uncharacterized protein (DUF4213/DUF364 family)
MTEPLSHFYNKIGYSPNEIKQFIIGKKYALVELNNGFCGVCGKNNQQLSAKISTSLNLNKFHDRLLYNCYVNAKTSCLYQQWPKSSFVETVDIEKYKNVVMIGLFRPLLKRYHKKQVYPAVFDMNKNEPGLTPMHKQAEMLQKAGLVIISATTVANQTFMDIINQCSPKAVKVLTGPSAILHPDMFNYIPSGVISGMVFAPNNAPLVASINAGHGTRHFKHFGKKIDIVNN